MLAPGTPRTYRALVREAIRRLAEAGVEAPQREAEWLACEALGCSRVHLLAYSERLAAPEQAAALAAFVARRRQGEPVQYIVGHTDFFGLRMQVSPAVLIPRPETEQVVEAALVRIAGTPAPRVLDAGTGSGCIALAIQHRRPDAAVAACDLHADALAVAERNAAALGLAVRFFEADVLAEDFTDRAPGGLDLLISNPPYVPDAEAPELAPEVREHEPHAALFSGPDPLRFYRALMQHARQLLAPGGHLVFETHADHGEAVWRLLEAEGFSGAVLQNDLAGRPRIAAACR